MTHGAWEVARRKAAAPSVSVDISSADIALSRILTNISDPSLAGYLTSVVAHRFADRASTRFAQSGDSASGAWAALAEATVEIRKNLGYTPGTARGEINVRTGTLRDWLTKPETMTVPDGLGVSMAWPGPEPDAATASKLAQAAGKKKGPARPVVAYDMADVSYILTTLAAWTLTGGAK